MSFNDHEYIKGLADQVYKANPGAPIFFGRGILQIHANKAFENMTADSVVVHCDGSKMHAELENNHVPVEGASVSTETDEASLVEFREELGKLVGFKFK